MYCFGPGWPRNVRAQASGLDHVENPPFSVSDFLEMYPQFGTEEAQNALPAALLELLVEMAGDICRYSQWGQWWRYAVGLLIAHLATLHMQGAVPDGAGARQIAASGQITGVASSKAVGGVSVSYDVGTLLQGFEEWGAFRLTSYGLQYATLAGTVGTAGMLV